MIGDKEEHADMRIIDVMPLADGWTVRGEPTDKEPPQRFNPAIIRDPGDRVG